MAQFDVFPNRGGNADVIPFILDIQSDLLAPLRTRLVVPLIAESELRPISRLNPTFDIGDRSVVMSTQEIVAYPTELLKERVASLAEFRDEIIAAVDFLVQGF